MLPCPFCGCDTPELGNTHTPYFSVTCSECGGEISGESFGAHPKGNGKFHYDPEPAGPFNGDYHELPANYRRAARSAVAAWNRRAYA
jgi:hypothetical protein